MEKDYEDRSRWYGLLLSNCIQGLVAREGNEALVYVVTVDPDIAEIDYHDRKPRIISMSGTVTTLSVTAAL